jgi:hypothetical protein
MEVLPVQLVLLVVEELLEKVILQLVEVLELLIEVQVEGVDHH